MMPKMRQANPLIWLLLLLTAWVLLAAPHVGQKTAWGNFYGESPPVLWTLASRLKYCFS